MAQFERSLRAVVLARVRASPVASLIRFLPDGSTRIRREGAEAR